MTGDGSHHDGERAATGNKITYAGMAPSNLESKILRGYVLGDTGSLKRQLAGK
jgi:hypothetical protein